MMKWTLVAIVGASSMAAADPSPWDATYQHDARGGNELCPETSVNVVISGGKFSMVWNVQGRGGKQLFRVGRIEGSVRDTGFAVFTATLMDPFPSAAAAELQALGDTVEQLQQIAKEMKVVLTARKDQRQLDLASGNCYARWVAAGGVPEAKPAGAVTPAKASKPAKPFKAPEPMAAGAAKWDSTYAMTMHYTSEWWCPRGEGFKTLVVKQGRLAIPWRLEMTSRTGRSFGDTLVGQLDGTIAANGSVKTRGTFVDDLPPEMEGKSITSVKQMKPTVKLVADGRGRQMHVAIGSACEYDFNASDYKLPKAPPRTSSKSDDANKPAKKRGDKVNGAQCYSDDSCQSGICSQRMCAPTRHSTGKLANGEHCDTDSDCHSGKCDSSDDVCTSGDRFKKELGTGAKCEDDDDCSSHQCENGVCDD